MNFENSYFKLLSNEILIKILENVTTFDLLQFCTAYNGDDFLQVNALAKNINLCREYGLENLKTLNKKVNLSCITTLNINGLYWISGNDLRRFVKKLTNLTVLLAIDTALDLKQDDFNVYRTLNLKKLAITVRETDISTKIPLITVETLLIKLLTNVEIPWKLFPAMKSLWFEGPRPINANVDKLLLKAQGWYPSNFIARQCQYLTSRVHELTTLFYDDVLLPEIVVYRWPEDWQVLRSARHERPFPYRTFYALKTKNIDEIMLEELNFQHPLCFLDRTIYKQILSSAYTKQLQKLSVNLCLLLCDHLKKPKISDEIVFKKRRLGLDDQPCRFFEEHFLYNCQSLQVLELSACKGIKGEHEDSSLHKLHHSLSLLCNLKQLKYLSIDILQILNGKFLINVLNECQQLEVLKISYLTYNNVFNLHLCKALLSAHNLKDFRLKTKTITISRILTVFCNLKKPKLQRISLICDEIDETETNYDRILEEFLESNPQLIFVYFSFMKCPQKTHKSINSILTKFKRQQARRYYIITKPSIVDQQNLNIPQMHYEEMVLCRSIVSHPDAYEDFRDF